MRMPMALRLFSLRNLPIVVSGPMNLARVRMKLSDGLIVKSIAMASETSVKMRVAGSSKTEAVALTAEVITSSCLFFGGLTTTTSVRRALLFRFVLRERRLTVEEPRESLLRPLGTVVTVTVSLVAIVKTC